MAVWRELRTDLMRSYAQYSQADPRQNEHLRNELSRNSDAADLRLAGYVRRREYERWQTFPSRLRAVIPPPRLSNAYGLHLQALEALASAGRSFSLSDDPFTRPELAVEAEQAGDVALLSLWLSLQRSDEELQAIGIAPERYGAPDPGPHCWASVCGGDEPGNPGRDGHMREMGPPPPELARGPD